jgi:hypothetical protein
MGSVDKNFHSFLTLSIKRGKNQLEALPLIPLGGLTATPTALTEEVKKCPRSIHTYQVLCIFSVTVTTVQNPHFTQDSIKFFRTLTKYLQPIKENMM